MIFANVQTLDILRPVLSRMTCRRKDGLSCLRPSSERCSDRWSKRDANRMPSDRALDYVGPFPAFSKSEIDGLVFPVLMSAFSPHHGECGYTITSACSTAAKTGRRCAKSMTPSANPGSHPDGISQDQKNTSMRQPVLSGYHLNN